MQTWKFVIKTGGPLLKLRSPNLIRHKTNVQEKPRFLKVLKIVISYWTITKIFNTFFDYYVGKQAVMECILICM